MVSRRKFLESLVSSGGLAILAGEQLSGSPLGSKILSQSLPRKGATKIGRFALVTRHNPVARKLDSLSPFTVGNGEFAFTGDITGLQTFPQAYENAMPLCTMSQWGWHTAPRAPELESATLRLVQYETYGRSVGYQTSSEGQGELYTWLRENPHRLHLGQIGLQLIRGSDQREARLEDVSDIEQTLDLWIGKITSRFKFEGQPVAVQTSVHPQHDLLAVTIESNLIKEGRLTARLTFPYGSPQMSAAEWHQPTRHQSELAGQSRSSAEIQRTLDADKYFVRLAWATPASLTHDKQHIFLLTPARAQGKLEFTVDFSPRRPTGSLPGARATFAASAAHWQRFWMLGGAVDVSDSRDPRAHELERRVVLSQYLTAIQCAGSQPPQETGLTVNSWYGKFHLEMHWWHAAHFPLWNRLPLLEKSLSWYDRVLPGAQALARSQGYAGARWPKMVGPEGRDSPSPIGPLLIWQQPHPIFYAELCYQVRGDRATLDRFREIVFESAEFMRCYAAFEPKRKRYMLGPPLIPAQENHPPRETWNPTFELAYWAHGLRTAQTWRERLGLKRNAEWDRVIENLSPLPVDDGVYLAHENCPQTYRERNHDHPSMLAALGVLPGDGVDRPTMHRTLQKVMKEWQWEKTWGWDYPLTAMTAARLGEPALAVDALLKTTEKNRYLPNGHNWQRTNLPCYLPGNGGLLYAVAMMAGGWRGAPRKPAPGFPGDGSWVVKAETLNASLLSRV